MIEGNDGGACVSFNGGETWSSIYNQMTAQFYHVTADNRTPYRVYGTQQDNTSVSVPSRNRKGAITWEECRVVGSGESGHIAVHPDNPNVVFAGAIGSSPGGGGNLLRYDYAADQTRISHRLARALHRPRREGDEVPLPVDLSHLLLPPPPRHPLRCGQPSLCLARPGPELAAPQPRPHPRRPFHPGTFRRPDN